MSVSKSVSLDEEIYREISDMDEDGFTSSKINKLLREALEKRGNKP